MAAGDHNTNTGQRVGLPHRPFLYTIDQLATLLAVEERTVKTSLLFYDGRSVGARPKDQMMARNIAPAGETPDWRVAENELIRFLKQRGFKFYERGWAQR